MGAFQGPAQAPTPEHTCGPFVGMAVSCDFCGRPALTVALEALATVYTTAGMGVWLDATHSGRYRGETASGALLGLVGADAANDAVAHARQLADGNFA